MSLRRLLNVTYALLLEGRDQAEVEKLDVLLEGPEGPTAIKQQARANREFSQMFGMVEVAR